MTTRSGPKCERCEFFQSKGYYQGQIHHCRTCHRSWTGHTQAHCTRCHSHFSTPSAFDRHLTDEGCRQPEELRNKDGNFILGLRVDKWGRTWSFAGDGTPWWTHQVEMPRSPESGGCPDTSDPSPPSQKSHS